MIDNGSRINRNVFNLNMFYIFLALILRLNKLGVSPPKKFKVRLLFCGGKNRERCFIVLVQNTKQVI